MILITFFKDFSLTQNGVTLSSEQSTAKRLCRALAYLVKNRRRGVTTEEFSRHLHSAKPLKAEGSDSLVKVTLHRLRELLVPIAGRNALLLQNGVITFSNNLTFTSDADTLDRIFSDYEEANEEERLALFSKARELYRGRYLAPFLGESFTMPESERYHRRFLALCEDALSRLLDKGLYAEIAKITQALSTIDPYAECFHYFRIKALMQLGDTMLARSLYHNITALYQREYHVTPSSRFHALKRELEPTARFSADTAKEALLTLENAAIARADRALIADPIDLYRALSLVEGGNLLLLTGDLDKITPDLLRLFSDRSLLTYLKADALLLVSTLPDEVFERHVTTLSAMISLSHFKIRLSVTKYPT